MSDWKINENIQGSFRDPSGFLFTRDGLVYRQVNKTYEENYNFLISSGLYKNLENEALLIPHDEVNFDFPKPDVGYKIIKPEPLEFISYPYEWCFSQLKDAALTTIEIQKKALDSGMSLKDCSAYNIQFRKGKPVFIDTLSFEIYKEGAPWVAYRQFCQHFLAPLALMAYKDVRLNQLFRVYVDGIPLDLANKLLPSRTFLDFSLLLHIHLHARSQSYFGNKPLGQEIKKRKFSRMSMLGLVDNLKSAIEKLKWHPRQTEWADYYMDSNYSDEALNHKKQIVSEFLKILNPKLVWDLGGNIGLFSRIAAGQGAQVVSFDIDPAAVEKNYFECVRKGEANVLPILVDFTNPSPNIGWQNQERMSLLERGPADTALSLALIHHLAISNNLPFYRIADFFSRICNFLIIEFVPKNDSQVKRMLSAREDIFPDYTQQAFECDFGKYFKVLNSVKIKDSERVLYVMKKSKL